MSRVLRRRDSGFSCRCGWLISSFEFDWCDHAKRGVRAECSLLEDDDREWGSSMPASRVLEDIRKHATSERDTGERFERLIQEAFRTDRTERNAPGPSTAR